MLFVYIDESQQDHPSMDVKSFVRIIFGFCLPEEEISTLSKNLRKIKEDLGIPADKEVKASKALRKYNYENDMPYWQLSARIFECYKSLPVTNFAMAYDLYELAKNLKVSLSGVAHAIIVRHGVLATVYRYFIRRIYCLLLQKQQDRALFVFDGDGPGLHKGGRKGVAKEWNNFLFKNRRNYVNKILPDPLFGDSDISAGLQFADFAAWVVRKRYEEAGGFWEPISTEDPYLGEIEKYYVIIDNKKLDLQDGNILYGFDQVSSKAIMKDL